MIGDITRKSFIIICKRTWKITWKLGYVGVDEDWGFRKVEVPYQEFLFLRMMVYWGLFWALNIPTTEFSSRFYWNYTVCNNGLNNNA